MIAGRAGWAVRAVSEPVTIYSYRGGLVSINYQGRCWCVGATNFVPGMGNRYTGRGYRGRMEADAVAKLEEIFKENPK